MSIKYCDYCNRFINLDEQLEHFEFDSDGKAICVREVEDAEYRGFIHDLVRNKEPKWN